MNEIKADALSHNMEDYKDLQPDMQPLQIAKTANGAETHLASRNT
jgi:hypothetical protein